MIILIYFNFDDILKSNQKFFNQNNFSHNFFNQKPNFFNQNFLTKLSLASIIFSVIFFRFFRLFAEKLRKFQPSKKRFILIKKFPWLWKVEIFNAFIKFALFLWKKFANIRLILILKIFTFFSRTELIPFFYSSGIFIVT